MNDGYDPITGDLITHLGPHDDLYESDHIEDPNLCEGWSVLDDDCEHESRSGMDDLGSADPAKAWRCDACGVTGTRDELNPPIQETPQ